MCKILCRRLTFKEHALLRAQKQTRSTVFTHRSFHDDLLNANWAVESLEQKVRTKKNCYRERGTKKQCSIFIFHSLFVYYCSLKLLNESQLLLCFFNNTNSNQIRILQFQFTIHDSNKNFMLTFVHYCF